MHASSCDIQRMILKILYSTMHSTVRKKVPYSRTTFNLVAKFDVEQVVGPFFKAGSAQDKLSDYIISRKAKIIQLEVQ